MAAVPHAETTTGRRAALKRGLAIPPAASGGAPGFPVTDAAHWDKARQAVGRVADPARRAQVAKLLRKTAPRFGKTQALKQSWAGPGGGSSSHANDGTPMRSINMADDDTLTCPSCGHSGPSGSFGASGTSLDKSPEELRTPARGNVAGRAGFSPGSAGVNVRSGGGGGALANERGGRAAVELSGPGSRRLPVSGPPDLLVSRGTGGRAVVRHRQGGAEVAQLRRADDGTWIATVDGRDLAPRTHQRTALMEAVGTYNKTAVTPFRRAEAPLQPEPQQTELMARYGIPAVSALATPSAGVSDGPRVSMAADGDGTDDDGLSPRGQSIRDKLKKKGFTHARATQFAKRAQNTKPGQFGQGGS